MFRVAIYLKGVFKIASPLPNIKMEPIVYWFCLQKNRIIEWQHDFAGIPKSTVDQDGNNRFPGRRIGFQGLQKVKKSNRKLICIKRKDEKYILKFMHGLTKFLMILDCYMLVDCFFRIIPAKISA